MAGAAARAGGRRSGGGVATKSAREFIGAVTFEALTGRPVHTELVAEGHALDHIKLARAASLIVVAPATADFLSRAAAGRADDLLTACLLAADAPVLLVPAMNDRMWAHRATGTKRRPPALAGIHGARSGCGAARVAAGRERAGTNARARADSGARRPHARGAVCARGSPCARDGGPDAWLGSRAFHLQSQQRQDGGRDCGGRVAPRCGCHARRRGPSPLRHRTMCAW